VSEDSLEIKAVAPFYRLRLFVAGNEPNSGKAKQILTRICERHLKDRYEIQIVDVLEDYQSAIAHHVMVVPTLIVETPTKKMVFVGSLSDEEKLLGAFDIPNSEQCP
jgi:circadian clock protein KaiB